ncbi:type IV secretory pathway VirB10-like protein [Saccharomonospora amisosensis]|uniref:Type IV secretory pathway VirB10-like protein n=1 Tax=Saccharomonospora amisosensis TaxID=1128677 RepID=A0A7X5UL01_9PSEU|nr:hypothetical protein [Saccharomonospora amisosensis]NIJ09931.1 type IV secretory pathway VirB10-like protein [Saccharomonospora amisosensis]
MDFEAVADELYAARREEFTRLREERAARARADGSRDLAERIRKLRKPTSSAALVNHLARSRPDDVAGLRELGEALRDAHTELAGDRLRELSRQRHDLVRALTRAAAELASGGVSEAVSREVSETLDAAVADPESARAVQRGRLVSALRPPDPFAGAWLPTMQQGGPAAREPAKGKRKEQARGERRQPEKRERADTARQRLKQAREAAAQARSARDTARKELRAAEREEAKARKRTAEARQALAAADREVAHAEQRVTDLSSG